MIRRVCMYMCSVRAHVHVCVWAAGSCGMYVQCFVWLTRNCRSAANAVLCARLHSCDLLQKQA